MESERNVRSKQRYYRRKNSKSPINIRGKIKELEEQYEKNHKNKDCLKNTVNYQKNNSPKNLNVTLQHFHQPITFNHANKNMVKNEDRNRWTTMNRNGNKNQRMGRTSGKSPSGRVLRINSDNSPLNKKNQT